MNDLLKQFDKETDDFKQYCEAFYNGELSPAEYKSKSGGFGTYAERGLRTGMLRLRIPAGELTPERMKFICDTIDKHKISKIHITTNQSIQLHNLQCDSIYEIMKEALKHGIITRGGGGDYPRNALASPLSGVEKGEFFDVLPYAKAVSDYVLTLIGNVKLPRKLKIGFSNSPENIVHATYRDMGFAANENNKFDLYTAGGLGVNPAFGVKTAENIEPEKVLYYVKTMVNMFTTYGNYESRAKARTRYIPLTIGEDKYLSEFRRMLDEVMTSENLDIDINLKSIQKIGDGLKSFNNRNVIEQKQHGLYAVKYHSLNGFPDTKVFKRLYEEISRMNDVTLRLSPKQSIYIINLTSKEAGKILDIIKEDNASTVLQESLTCVGSSVCQFGIGDSMGLLQKIVEMEKHENFQDGILPKIYISGCPSSCGTHQTSLIGLQGAKKKVGNEVSNVFKIFIGGDEKQGQEKFGDDFGAILEQDIPEMFKEVGKLVQQAGLTFEEWYSSNSNVFIELVRKYLV